MALLDPLEVYRATVVLCSDAPPLERPGPLFDALLMHAQSHGAETEVIACARHLLRNRRARAVAINGSRGEAWGRDIPGEAWPGADTYANLLADAVDPFPEQMHRSRPAYHTRDESDAFLELVREQRWSHVAIVTHAHHILRTFLGMIRAMQVAKLRLRVHAVVPQHTNWWIPVGGSQGSPVQERFQHIAGELERIERYQASGHIASFAELWEYLRWRDYIVP